LTKNPNWRTVLPIIINQCDRILRSCQHLCMGKEIAVHRITT
jgi:hypothetical protein